MNLFKSKKFVIFQLWKISVPISVDMMHSIEEQMFPRFSWFYCKEWDGIKKFLLVVWLVMLIGWLCWLVDWLILTKEQYLWIFTNLIKAHGFYQTANCNFLIDKYKDKITPVSLYGCWQCLPKLSYVCLI